MSKGNILLAAAAAAGLAQGAYAAGAPERLFLQKVSTHSTVVKWRGGDADRVCYSSKIKDLGKRNWPRCVDGIPTEGGHLEALLTGLAPDKGYFYSVGGHVDPGQYFNTAPNGNRPPRDGNTHILIVGDSGTQSEGDHDGEAAEVLAGFEQYNATQGGGEPLDLFLALGDNAYVAGTDAQWQESFFEIYPDILRSASVYTTIGNHEMGYGAVPLCAFDPRVPCPPEGPSIPFGGVSISDDPGSYDGNGDLQPDGGMPYLDIFSLPANGESGGVPSGTEQYYSANYGNVHIVSLDSQLTARDDVQRANMKAWLEADLAANTRDWTVVIFHHPPYTKGANHDSDEPNFVDGPELSLREEFTPVFEAYGVDVVYSGHSHSYERSYYLRGHTGISDTFDALTHAELNDAGEPSLGYGDDEYQQLSPTSGGVDDRVIYTVAGSSGKNDERGDRDTGEDWLQHEAHIPLTVNDDCTASGPAGATGCRGLAEKGSVVLDATATSLRARFVDVNGDVLDEFTINR